MVFSLPKAFRNGRLRMQRSANSTGNPTEELLPKYEIEIARSGDLSIPVIRKIMTSKAWQPDSSLVPGKYEARKFQRAGQGKRLRAPQNRGNPAGTDALWGID